MYERKSRLSGKLRGKLIEMFVAGATARTTAEITGVNRNTVRVFFQGLRKLIASKLPSYELSGEVEADESYFGGVRKRQTRTRCRRQDSGVWAFKTGWKGLHGHHPQCENRNAFAYHIKENVQSDSVVYTDSFKAYNALDVSDFHHRRINHSTLFAEERNHINGIENFWNQAKRHLRRFNGIKSDFYWFLKECEWRFNGGNHQMLLKQLKHWVKCSSH